MKPINGGIISSLNICIYSFLAMARIYYDRPCTACTFDHPSLSWVVTVRNDKSPNVCARRNSQCLSNTRLSRFRLSNLQKSIFESYL